MLGVKEHSIDDLMGLLEPYTAELKNKDYFGEIGWQENS